MAEASMDETFVVEDSMAYGPNDPDYEYESPVLDSEDQDLELSVDRQQQERQRQQQHLHLQQQKGRQEGPGYYSRVSCATLAIVIAIVLAAIAGTVIFCFPSTEPVTLSTC